MKLAIITQYWKKSPGGGIKTYLVNLVEELKRRNVKVNVLFKEGDDPENHQINGWKFFFSIKAFFVLGKMKPQVIHSHGIWSLLPGYLYKKCYKTRLIYTFHTQPVKKMSTFVKIFVQILLNGCDCVTFVSEGLKKKIEEIEELKFENTAITYAGVKSRVVSEREIKEFYKRYGIKDNSIVLLALGLTALPYKAEGAKLLIKAVKKLCDKYPNIILILTRQGTYSTELKDFAKNEGVADYVIFTGDVDNPYVPLAICDVYTHITLGEGLPLAVLEAMSMGKPIIATSIGGIPEAINDGNNGKLIKPDVDEIIENIECLLENETLAKGLGRNAKKRVEENFSWEKVAEKFIEIYKNKGD